MNAKSKETHSMKKDLQGCATGICKIQIKSSNEATVKLFAKFSYQYLQISKPFKNFFALQRKQTTYIGYCLASV